MSVAKMNPLFATDFYKIGHPSQYHPLTELIFSGFTPRSGKLFPHWTTPDHRVVVAGIQPIIKWLLVDFFGDNFFKRPKEEVVSEYEKMMSLGLGTPISGDRIAELHDLGYLPLEVRALPEGSLCPIQVPVYTVHNTDKRFGWLTNSLETILSAETWKPMTTATIALQYLRLCKSSAQETCDTLEHLMFQCHDFSFRGLSGLNDAYYSGIGHLLSFSGTDNIPAIMNAFDNYGAEGFVAGSIPASEHSVATTNIGFIIETLKEKMPKATLDELRYEAEVIFLRRYITEIYPAGLASYVADSYDYWAVITKILVELKDEILARDGKLVLRPDSGNPVDIICGTIDFRDVKDYTEECEDLDEAAEWLEETIVDRVGDETPHGEYGEDSPTGLMIFKGEMYQVELTLEWNRHDKQYYYIDGHNISSITKVDMTAEQKGSIEVLWEIFGGSVNSKGYKVLDSHIGLIYGDSITVERTKEIFARLKAKGFASSNIVLGVGSYTYNYLTRDSLGFACKATGSIIDGVEVLVSKEPKTDMKKKSAKGFMKVIEKDGRLKLVDGLSFEDIQAEDNMLQVVFRDGEIKRFEKFSDVRARLAAQV